MRSFLYALARLLGDINAMKRGTVGKRIARRAAGVLARVLATGADEAVGKGRTPRAAYSYKDSGRSLVLLRAIVAPSLQEQPILLATVDLPLQPEQVEWFLAIFRREASFLERR